MAECTVGLKWQHALVAVVAGAVTAYSCVHALSGVWDGYCAHPYFYFGGLFVGLTSFLAGVLAFGMIGIKEMVTRLWDLIRS